MRHIKLTKAQRAILNVELGDLVVAIFSGEPFEVHSARRAHVASMNAIGYGKVRLAGTIKLNGLANPVKPSEAHGAILLDGFRAGWSQWITGQNFEPNVHTIGEAISTALFSVDAQEQPADSFAIYRTAIAVGYAMAAHYSAHGVGHDRPHRNDAGNFYCEWAGVGERPAG